MPHEAGSDESILPVPVQTTEKVQTIAIFRPVVLRSLPVHKSEDECPTQQSNGWAYPRFCSFRTQPGKIRENTASSG